MFDEDDAYDLALSAASLDCVPTCIPVVEASGGNAVAIVTLKPNIVARAALEHQTPRVRARAHVAVAIKAHSLIGDEGMIFRCR